ncbi:hypothetical protein [Polaribacter atrinae]|uniref:Uncharacterized protein n=1 Tax=Polaribacter atrinae TaxID=1333662 RepID=A0A176TE34_9FLAO|nr:hypothetical protein [Polaribacter atrinae]OAD45793.1 hypothetical protein LPB303_05765 [Polaribacter atrinae]
MISTKKNKYKILVFDKLFYQFATASSVAKNDNYHTTNTSFLANNLNVFINNLSPKENFQMVPSFY